MELWCGSLGSFFRWKRTVSRQILRGRCNTIPKVTTISKLPIKLDRHNSVFKLLYPLLLYYFLINSGYYLPCPEEIKQSSWPVDAFYNQMAKRCFVMNPNERCNFKDIVNILEKELDEEQRLRYIALSNQYYLSRPNI